MGKIPRFEKMLLVETLPGLANKKETYKLFIAITKIFVDFT